MPIWATVSLAILGSSAIFGFVQFLITRKDNKHDKTKELSEQIAGLSQQMTNMHAEMDAGFAKSKADSEAGDRMIMDMIQQNEALQARVRVLNASDELRRQVKHSQEYFDQLNEDITKYERYCTTHPDFKNNKAVRAIDHINTVYNKCLTENSFL